MEEKLDVIERKLNIILRMLTRMSLPDGPQKEQVAFLSSLDLRANEMADIVGTSPATIRKALSRLRAEERQNGALTDE